MSFSHLLLGLLLSSRQSTRRRPQNEYWLPAHHIIRLWKLVSPCRRDTHARSKLFCNSNLVETCIYLLSSDRRENIVHWLNTRPSLLVKPGNYHLRTSHPTAPHFYFRKRRNIHLVFWEPTLIIHPWTLWYMNRISSYVLGLCDDTLSVTLAIQCRKKACTHYKCSTWWWRRKTGRGLVQNASVILESNICYAGPVLSTWRIWSGVRTFICVTWSPVTSFITFFQGNEIPNLYYFKT